MSGNYVYAMYSRTNTEDVYFVIGVLWLPIKKKNVLNVCPSIFFLLSQFWLFVYMIYVIPGDMMVQWLARVQEGPLEEINWGAF